uniref:Uncharacterized protein n=1 Tax=Leersia perrieri TaxID=77586 RepID=A0A0D9W2U6_9ORYZ
MGKRSFPSSQADDQVGTEIRRWWQATCRLQWCHLKSLLTLPLQPAELRVVCEDRNDFTTVLQKPLP